MDERFRYIMYPFCNYIELFDHREDPAECDNLADDPGYATDRTRLHAALAEAQLRAVNPTYGRVGSW